MRSLPVVAAILLLPSPALAAQFVVAEVTYEHSATTTTDSHLRLPPSAETPTSWKAPVDYATAGTVWVRLEVFTKPSAEKTRFQVCFEATPSYACTNQSPIYTTTGVYTWSTPFPSFYQYDKVDWTKGIVKTALILKDDANVKPAPENVGAARSALFMPTKLRVTVTVVAPGSTYVPPPAGDAGVDAATDALPDATSDTSIDAPVEVGTSIDASTIDAGADAPPTAETDAGETSGCAVARRRTAGTAWLLLALSLGLFRRRRQ